MRRDWICKCLPIPRLEPSSSKPLSLMLSNVAASLEIATLLTLNIPYFSASSKRRLNPDLGYGCGTQDRIPYRCKA